MNKLQKLKSSALPTWRIVWLRLYRLWKAPVEWIRKKKSMMFTETYFLRVSFLAKVKKPHWTTIRSQTSKFSLQIFRSGRQKDRSNCIGVGAHMSSCLCCFLHSSCTLPVRFRCVERTLKLFVFRIFSKKISLFGHINYVWRSVFQVFLQIVEKSGT